MNVEVPPLRARPNDLLFLANHFLRLYADENGKSVNALSDDAAERIVAYRWPGNVRELQNAIERAVIMSEGMTLTAKHLPADLGSSPPRAIVVPGSTLDEIERHAILTTLAQCGGRTIAAARVLGIRVRNVQDRLHAYGVARPPR